VNIKIATSTKTLSEQIMAASTEEEDVSKQLTQQVEDLSINNDILTTCANCGKEGNNLNICNKCKAATYCNASCKKKHRSKHKVACERRIAELQEEELERERQAAELHDEKLFKQPPPMEDYPICMLPLPSLYTGHKYNACCGKRICSGCIYAVEKRDGVGLCPFCRTPAPTTNEDTSIQVKKRVELGDADAIHNLGCCYSDGDCGLPRDHAKALELWHQAAELGNATSYCNIGYVYISGDGVERDGKKAVHYMELAAMGGRVEARHNLGVLEKRAGNMDRALRHYMIAAGAGSTDSLETIKQMFINGHATKDDYTKALRVYQANLVEIKSPQRDQAAAFNDRFKYY
jgi:TPR repeat protein